MYTLGIDGPDAGAATDRIAAALDGRVAVVRHLVEDGAVGAAAATPATTYDLGDGWRATGDDDLSLDGALDRLAPDHDYALAVGFPKARIPQVALGGVDVADELVRVPDADALDLDAVVEALHDRPERETLDSLVARVKRSPDADRAGAVATFTGRVRARDAADDAPTEYLEFEMYDGVAQRTMRRIEAELEERDGVLAVAMHHRQGVIPDGEDIVFVVVLAGHRGEAFETVSDGIDRLKDEVPIFKKEVTAEETFWVHEAERDGA
ncbi:molybdopterin synthase [Halosegnis marinus]|uniref:Molybdopterin synthase n=1 Tax=Halosegnis marinus TaxID=3034023 RepID=A0ABD5ZPT5_9EURY|nr:molybdopterin synthase [Halosegnis sp. DT85]